MHMRKVQGALCWTSMGLTSGPAQAYFGSAAIICGHSVVGKSEILWQLILQLHVHWLGSGCLCFRLDSLTDLYSVEASTHIVLQPAV